MNSCESKGLSGSSGAVIASNGKRESVIGVLTVASYEINTHMNMKVHRFVRRGVERFAKSFQNAMREWTRNRISAYMESGLNGMKKNSQSNAEHVPYVELINHAENTSQSTMTTNAAPTKRHAIDAAEGFYVIAVIYLLNVQKLFRGGWIMSQPILRGIA